MNVKKGESKSVKFASHPVAWLARFNYLKYRSHCSFIVQLACVYFAIILSNHRLSCITNAVFLRACNKFNFHVFNTAAIFVSVEWFLCTLLTVPSSGYRAIHVFIMIFTTLMIIISIVKSQRVLWSSHLSIKPWFESPIKSGWNFLMHDCDPCHEKFKLLSV